eukprot:gene17063-20327_t
MTVFVIISGRRSQAQIPILDIVKGAIKKVIKAVDLQIQRQQNKIIWLQNAQKVLENEMSKLKLDQISDWTARQKEQYGKYFEELGKVKSLIAYYQRISDIIRKQQQMVASYRHAWGLIRNDKHFTIEEVDYMGKVYSGLLEESVKNLEEVALVINSFKTTMTDAKRIEIMDKAADRIEKNNSDLQQFNRENGLLSLQRSRSLAESARIKALSAQTFAEWFQQKKTQKKYLIEQIAALKIYAGYVKKGYDIGKQGLTTIGRIKDGDFNLHRDFFGALNYVNPEIKRYPRVADIMDLQGRILSLQQKTMQQISKSEWIQSQERQYCQGVYARLLEDCNHDMEELIRITGDGQLVMKDDERMQRIDVLYQQMQDKYSFCRSFSDAALQLIIGREREQQHINRMKNIYGL